MSTPPTPAVIAAPSRGGQRVITHDEMLAYLQQHVRLTEDGCRVWAGTATGRRIPVAMWGGRMHNARRLLLELQGRVLTVHQVVYACCGTRNCMRLDHLRVGTRAQMVRSMAARGDTSRGRPHAVAVAAGRAVGARLPMTERHNVARMRADGWIWARIAAHYGVSPSAPQKAFAGWEKLFGPAAFWARGDDERIAA